MQQAEPVSLAETQGPAGRGRSSAAPGGQLLRQDSLPGLLWAQAEPGAPLSTDPAQGSQSTVQGLLQGTTQGPASACVQDAGRGAQQAGAGLQDTAIGVAIDFETSGRAAHSACAVGLARMEGGRVTSTFYSLIRPPSSRVFFTEIHGLTWAMLKDAAPFAEVWPRAAALLRGASFLVAHNASFDRRVLQASCRATGLPEPSLPFFCTLKGARRSLPLPSKRLNCVCEYFGIELDHHHALSDAVGCAEIFLRLQALGVSPALMKL